MVLVRAVAIGILSFCALLTGILRYINRLETYNCIWDCGGECPTVDTNLCQYQRLGVGFSLSRKMAV